MGDGKQGVELETSNIQHPTLNIEVGPANHQGTKGRQDEQDGNWKPLSSHKLDAPPIVVGDEVTRLKLSLATSISRKSTSLLTSSPTFQKWKRRIATETGFFPVRSVSLCLSLPFGRG